MIPLHVRSGDEERVQEELRQKKESKDAREAEMLKAKKRIRVVMTLMMHQKLCIASKGAWMVAFQRLCKIFWRIPAWPSSKWSRTDWLLRLLWAWKPVQMSRCFTSKCWRAARSSCFPQAMATQSYFNGINRIMQGWCQNPRHGGENVLRS